MTEILQEKWMKGVALTTTCLAVLASIAASRSAFFTARGQLLTAQEGSQWAYYQAKSIKQHLEEKQKDSLEIASRGSLTGSQKELIEKQLKAAETAVERYSQEKTDIQNNAERTSRENILAVRRGAQFSLSVVFLQIGIMLSSVSALVKRRELWYVGLIGGLGGTIYLANGFLLLF